MSPEMVLKSVYCRSVGRVLVAHIHATNRFQTCQMTVGYTFSETILLFVEQMRGRQTS